MECSVLEAALRHNPLFFLANPNAAKKDTDSKDKKAGAAASSDEDSPTAATPAGASVPVRLERGADRDQDAAQTTGDRPNVTCAEPTSERAQGRRRRKKRKLQALLQMILHNDQTRSSSSAVDECSEEKRARLESGTCGAGETEPTPSDSTSYRELRSTPGAGETETTPSDSTSYRELRSAVKQRRRQIRAPSVELSTSGDHASLVMAAHSRTPLFLRDVQTLLLNACVPEHAPWTTRWCNLNHAVHLSRTLAVIVDGLSLRDVQKHSDVLRSTLTLFPIQTELVAPAHYGTTVAEEVLNVPLSITQKHRIAKLLGSLDSAVQTGIIHRQWGNDPPAATGLPSTCAASSTTTSLSSPATSTPSATTESTTTTSTALPSSAASLPPATANRASSSALPKHLPTRGAAIGRTQLLLDVSQLMDEGYPLPDAGHYSKQYQHFVPTSDKYRPVTDTSPMFAVDCEMCLTREGSELTSISVLDETERLVYGTLVMPDHPITDYLTRWSGITEDKLRGVTTRLADVQQHLRKILPPDCILLGQSLNNDLRAMQMMHPYIIDTSVIFNITGQRQKKTKLSLLSYMFLGETIQCQEEGHDATEDALASLRLVQRKLAKGYTYGDAVQGGYVPSMNGPDRRDDDRLPAAVNVDGYYTSLLQRMDEVGVTTSIVATGPDVDIYRLACDSTDHPSLALQCVANNRQVADLTASRLASADLSLCHMDLRGRLHHSTPAESARAHLRRLDKRLRRLFRAAPLHALVTVVCAGAEGQNGVIENGVCLTAVKQDVQESASASTDNDGETDPPAAS